MNIGIIGSLSQPITLTAAGGTEIFCAFIATELGKLGHTVTLFATEDSKLDVENVRIIPVAPHSMVETKKSFMESQKREMNPDEKIRLQTSYDVRALLIAQQYQDEIDIFHDNMSNPITGAASTLFKKPILTTMHLPPTGYSGYITLPPYVIQPRIEYVAISKWQKDMLPHLKYQVYNGLNIGLFKFYTEASQDLAWIGRINPATPKGLKEAMLATKKSGKRLTFQGHISNEEYYKKEIVPLIDDSVTKIEKFASVAEKNHFFGSSKAFIFPALWEEPFPFVVLESYTCGTPIIAYARGSLTETVEDGITGFLVNSSDDDIRGDYIVKKTGVEGLTEAIERLYSLPANEYKKMRETCRKRVEEKYSSQKMAENYVKVYEDILKNFKS